MNDEKPLLRVLRRVPMSVVIASPVTGKILWVNERVAEMYGARDTDEIIGMSLLDFIQPHQAAKALADLARVAIGQSPPPVTYDLKRKDGSYAAGQVSSVPMVWEGQPAMLSFLADVSEREMLLKALQESEERYRLLLEQLDESSGRAVAEEG